MPSYQSTYCFSLECGEPQVSLYQMPELVEIEKDSDFEAYRYRSLEERFTKCMMERIADYQHVGLKPLKHKVRNLKVEIDHRQAEIQYREKEVNDRHIEILSRKKDSESYIEEIQNRKEEVEDHKKEIQKRKKEIRLRKEEIKNLNDKITKRSVDIKDRCRGQSDDVNKQDPIIDTIDSKPNSQNNESQSKSVQELIKKSG